MIPLVMTRVEFDIIKARVRRHGGGRRQGDAASLSNYSVGTMIELPRAALRAGEIAQSAEFFSFGTNDLTQTTLGISRDDAASFLGDLYPEGNPAVGPVRVDRPGRRVGELVEIAAERGRKTRPTIKLGICGEHGGDPSEHRLLRAHGTRLRLLLAVSRADRAFGGGPGGARSKAREGQA